MHMLAGNDSSTGNENKNADAAPRREKPARPAKTRKPDAYHRR